MRKHGRRLSLSKETLRHLQEKSTGQVVGAASRFCYPSKDLTDCTECPSNPFICQPVVTQSVWNPDSVICQTCA